MARRAIVQGSLKMVPGGLVTTALHSFTLPFTDAMVSVWETLNAFSDLDRNTILPNLPCLNMWASCEPHFAVRTPPTPCAN